MAFGLHSMGVQIEIAGERWFVDPPERLSPPGEPLILGNAGTAVRFLTGLAPLVPGPYLIDGNAAMRRRPMPVLLGALRGLGVSVEELGRAGCPPVRLSGTKSRVGAAGAPEAVRFESGLSSQELSALLMLGAALPGGLSVFVQGQLPSRPYVELTIDVLEAFGVQVSEDQVVGAEVSERGTEFCVSPGPPRAAEYNVEGDWSSASYPLAAGFITGREVSINNLSPDSRQGDRVFPDLLERLAGPGPRTIDLVDAPDLAPSVVACALFADGETAITGAAHLRVKESDRIAVLVRELSKLGADLEERPDGITVRPRPLRGPAELDPSADHRMAMAFGLVSLRVPDLHILDADCVSKSYPDYWSMLGCFR